MALTFHIPSGADLTVKMDPHMYRAADGRMLSRRGEQHHEVECDPELFAHAVAEMLNEADADDRVAFLRALAEGLKRYPMVSDALSAVSR